MATATTSGVWPSINASLPGLNGLGTSNVKWGVPAGGGQSGYRFTGATVEVLTDGTEFVLGTFTHDNFPVYGFQPNQFDVDLRVNVAFNNGALLRDFSFRFHHNETPNVWPAPQDLVDLPTLQSPETVELDGEEYALVIAGFKQGGQIVTRFVSEENGSNSADIVAKLQLIVKPIQTYLFHTYNPDGSVFGSGCFTYKGEEKPVDIAHIIGGLGHGPKLTEFWYTDPLIGTIGLAQLMGMNFKRGAGDDEPSRFTINAYTLPGQETGITAGVATLKKPGPVSTHRADDVEHDEDRTLHFPELCVPGVPGEAVEEEVPLVDLVVVIDSSTSMKPDATSALELGQRRRSRRRRRSARRTSRSATSGSRASSPTRCFARRSASTSRSSGSRRATCAGASAARSRPAARRRTAGARSRTS